MAPSPDQAAGFPAERRTVYSGDSVPLRIRGLVPAPEPVEVGEEVRGRLFDGYPQIVKEPGSAPRYGVRVEKDVRIPMRDGARLCADVYRPDVEGERFPALLAFGMWGKNLQEAIGWLGEHPQPYYDSPFWDGTMEAMDFNYTVPRGYAHVIPDPRGTGDSEGYDAPETTYTLDIYDTVEWIAAQPWCNGKVGMMGPSSYAISQIFAGLVKPPHLVALRLDESPTGSGEAFTGIYDLLKYHILTGRHGNDSALPTPNYDYTPRPPELLGLPDVEERLAEALAHPDVRNNSKWYSYLRYPRKLPEFFDNFLSSFRPSPVPDNLTDRLFNVAGLDQLTLPMYLGAPWANRFYLWATLDVWEKTGTPAGKKKLILYPPGFPCRPYVEYHDELLRWHDYWLKGIDTGVLDEPPIKLFVGGIDKWRFEDEWPLARTRWTRLFLKPGGGLGPEPPGPSEPEAFTQPAPYLDPTVYCLRYDTGPLAEDLELTGPIVLYLQAAIDCDDTNWMVDLVDLDPDGNRRLVTSGHLKAAHRALDPERSRPYLPVHPRQRPVPVTPGEVVEYAIALMPAANVFRRGHAIELILRNQDDVLSRLGTWGVYHLPFMRTVTHHVHFGESHLLLPVIPAS